MKLVTIAVPDNAIKMQYALEEGGYEQWKTMTFGEIVAVEKGNEEGFEQGGGKDINAPTTGGTHDGV